MNNENSTKKIAAVKEQVQLDTWRLEAEARQVSGLSVKAWCAQNGRIPVGILPPIALAAGAEFMIKEFLQSVDVYRNRNHLQILLQDYF